MKRYIIALITIFTLLSLNTYSIAKPALQDYAVSVAEAAEAAPELNRTAGGIPESASLLLLGAGMLFIAIYIRKRLGRREG